MNLLTEDEEKQVIAEVHRFVVERLELMFTKYDEKFPANNEERIVNPLKVLDIVFRCKSKEIVVGFKRAKCNSKTDLGFSLKPNNLFSNTNIELTLEKYFKHSVDAIRQYVLDKQLEIVVTSSYSKD